MKSLPLLSVLLAVAVLAPRGRAAEAKPVADLFPDPVVARGKGFTIKQSQVDEHFTAFRANAAARGQVLPEEKRDDIVKTILDRLVVTQVLLGRATPEDKKKAGETADKFIAETRKQASSEEAFKRQISAMGMSYEEFTARILEQATAETVIEREVRAKVSAGAAEIQKFYAENGSRFEQPEAVKFTHIFFATVDRATRQPLPEAEKKKKLETAEQVLARVKKGEDVGKLALEFSDDPGTKSNGGEMTLARGMTRQPALESAVFTGKPGAPATLVTSDVGFHIVKVLEKIPAKKLALSEVSPRIKDALERQEVEKQLPDFFERIKKEAGVEMLAAKPKP
jgi:peptidyl-prolyl cis-trans isomerase C